MQVAQQNVGPYCDKLLYSRPNMEFREGHIEDLAGAGIANESIDIVISNCVINLSPDKEQVMKEAFRVLAVGGEFFFSDLYCNRRLPKAVMENKVDYLYCFYGRQLWLLLSMCMSSETACATRADLSDFDAMCLL